jgi:hypothetical protein
VAPPLPWAVLFAVLWFWLAGPPTRRALPAAGRPAVRSLDPPRGKTDRRSGERSWLVRTGLPSDLFGMSAGSGGTIRRVIKRANDCRRFKARISYRGEKFSGWQKQGPSTRTIEGTLEATLSPALGQALHFFPAGRTDAGVSALGQCITFDAMLASASPGACTPNDQPHAVCDARCALTSGADLSVPCQLGSSPRAKSAARR